NMSKPTGILLFIDEQINRLRRAETMQPDLHRPVIVVELDVKERVRIRTPHHAAVGLLDEIIEIFPACPVAHADREIFGALDVSAPGLEPVVRRMPRAAELEIVVLGGELVAV